MIAAIRRRWSALDNAIKQIVFVVGSIFATLLLGATVLGVVAGQWAGIAAVLSMLGIAGFLGGLVWLAARLFPDKPS